MWLRRRNGDAKDEVLAITGELAKLAEMTVIEARQVTLNARRSLARNGETVSGRAVRALGEIDRTSALAAQIIAQTRTRLAGEIPDGASRVVSLHDPDASPIRKGLLGRPVEFGYKAQVADNADGLVLDHHVMIGNPADAPLLAPALARIKARFGRAPKAVTADRGYGEATVETALVDAGVKTVAIPRHSRPGPARANLQRGRGFVRLIKWRTGSEARISCLKRDWGWRRTLLDGHVGAQIWCGWEVVAHNATKISGLQANQKTEPISWQLDHPHRRGGTDPPTPDPTAPTPDHPDFQGQVARVDRLAA